MAKDYPINIRMKERASFFKNVLAGKILKTSRRKGCKKKNPNKTNNRSFRIV